MALFIFVGAKVLSVFLNGVQSYLYNTVAADGTKRFSVAIFQHLQMLSMHFHITRKTGEVTRIMNRGANSIDTLMNTLLFRLLPTIVEAVVISAIFAKLGTPLIAVVTFATMILYFVVTYVVTQWRNKWRRDINDAINNLQEKEVDTLFNYETVKMFGMERFEVQLYDNLQTIYQQKFVFLRITLSALNFAQQFIQSSGRAIALVLAAQDSAKGLLTPGDFVLINSYISQLYAPLAYLGMSYRFISQAATDLERCIELLNQPLTVRDKPDAIPFVKSSVRTKVDAEEDDMRNSAAELRFENVSFVYENKVGADKTALKDDAESAKLQPATNGKDSSNRGVHNLNFSLSPGKMLAIVGASGAGKSTIIRLILRLYDTNSGCISIDGTDIADFQQESLRQHIGVVAQDTVLFNDTLRHNIGYGKPGATDAEIHAAAQAAALGPFISSLSDGLDTVVGERGVRLSGGERQRVGIARCLIKDPYLVLLDEATSSLDTRTEREIQAELRELSGKRTTVVVAHRLSTIMMADEILVMDKGNYGGVVVERGTHTELLKKEGMYYDMWQSQTELREGIYVEQNGNGNVKEEGKEELNGYGSIAGSG